MTKTAEAAAIYTHLHNAEDAVAAAVEHLTMAGAPEYLIGLVRKAGSEIYGYGCSVGGAG